MLDDMLSLDDEMIQTYILPDINEYELSNGTILYDQMNFKLGPQG